MSTTKRINTRQRLIDRLASYWKLEAANAVLIPGIMYYLSDGKIGYLACFTMVPMILLLVIGSAYWRAKLLQITTPQYNALPLLKLILRLRPYALALTFAALCCTMAGWLKPDITAGFNDRVTATAASILALSEYVNYYHRQLQHFDNMADFKRLLSGKGFRRSQMAIDLDALGK